MADIAAHRTALIARVVDGNGRASPSVRRAAFEKRSSELAAPVDALATKVVECAARIGDDDVAAAVRATSEDEVFEVVVCAALGEASRQYEAALALLEDLP